MIWWVALIIASIKISYLFIAIGGPIGLLVKGVLFIWARWQDWSTPVYPSPRPPGGRVIELVQRVEEVASTEADSLRRAA